MISEMFKGSEKAAIGGCFEVCLCGCRDSNDLTSDTEDDAVGEYYEGDIISPNN